MSKISRRCNGWGFVLSKKGSSRKIIPPIWEHGINDVKDRSKSEALHFEVLGFGIPVAISFADPRLPEVLQMRANKSGMRKQAKLQV